MSRPTGSRSRQSSGRGRVGTARTTLPSGIDRTRKSQSRRGDLLALRSGQRENGRFSPASPPRREGCGARTLRRIGVHDTSTNRAPQRDTRRLATARPTSRCVGRPCASWRQPIARGPRGRGHEGKPRTSVPSTKSVADPEPGARSSQVDGHDSSRQAHRALPAPAEEQSPGWASVQLDHKGQKRKARSTRGRGGRTGGPRVGGNTREEIGSVERSGGTGRPTRT